jgi:hypothetical protein
MATVRAHRLPRTQCGPQPALVDGQAVRVPGGVDELALERRRRFSEGVRVASGIAVTSRVTARSDNTQGRQHGLLHLPTGHPDPDREAGEREVAVAPGDLGEPEALPRTRQRGTGRWRARPQAEVARPPTVEKPAMNKLLTTAGPDLKR